ncbi:unnamed protein product [Rhizoctonia solani]|uniref:Fungal-type protein kinase domain-containing protein n=1 Tax=Rhizoctonia solani TaxID=456999 RepID=A0A8H2XB19_9AGAM|nr:unnamed protein product [Rhizoctonia solani]CAE6446192.1 unnamed protein product [Rhizoctonia solani]
MLDPKHPAWATQIGNAVYLSETPRAHAGPGQRRYTTVAINLMKNDTIFIKDIWRAESRLFFEGSLLEQAHKGSRLPGLMSVHFHGYVPDGIGMRVRTTCLDPEKTAGGRYKVRMVTKDIGCPLEGVCSLREFLDGNIMFAPRTDEFRERCTGGYVEVKFANQVLAKDKDAQPEPACLVIDLGNGADLKVKRDRDALTERTGTPKFLARPVSSGELLPKDDFNSQGVDMPPTKGPLADYSQFMHANEYQLYSHPGPASEPDVEFSHRLFHDAESTFWVIVWTLARSTRQGSKLATDPEKFFRKFFHVMYRHNPTPGFTDPQTRIYLRSLSHWNSILHPDLAKLG